MLLNIALTCHEGVYYKVVAIFSLSAHCDTDCYTNLLKVLIQITGANVPPRPLESMLLSCRKILASGEMGSPASHRWSSGDIKSTTPSQPNALPFNDKSLNRIKTHNASTVNIWPCLKLRVNLLQSTNLAIFNNYCIAQIQVGETLAKLAKCNVIRQYFTQPNFKFSKVAIC